METVFIFLKHMYTYYVVCVCQRKEGGNEKSSVGVCGMCAEQNLFLDKYSF